MLSPISQKNKSLSTFAYPEEVLTIIKKLSDNGFQAFLVGGCVRDILMNKTPKDWDICTSATPDKIQTLFPDSFYENDFGTVGIKSELGVIEVTPFRTEGEYKDGRRPESVSFGTSIQEDLQRRDFTMNAIALNPVSHETIDPFGGEKDIKDKIIRAVGAPKDRFSEDGLRIMRLFRFASQLDFSIDYETLQAAIETRDILSRISKERIRDEFTKLLMSHNPSIGFMYMDKTDTLSFISPYIAEAVGVEQNGMHAYHVFEHLVRSLQHAADKNMSLELRLSALLHDIGKPATRKWSKEKKDYTFYGHEVVGAKMTKKILTDLKFSHETVEVVSKLVRWHMFFSDTEQITHSAVRRMISNVGKEHIWDLINLRMCDRIGTGRPKEDPYRLRKYMSLIEEVMADPTDVSMLKINGNDIISELHVKPGPMLGKILHILLDMCLENPKLNNKESLLAEAKNILTKTEEEIDTLYLKALQTKQEENEEKIRKIRQNYKVS